MDLGTGSLTITTAHTVNAATVNAATIDIGTTTVPIAIVNTGTYTSTGATNIDAIDVNAISVNATAANIQADGSIRSAAVVSNTLTVRGNHSIVLINTTVDGRSGGQAFRSINLQLPFGDGRYTVNGMPFGPERAGIMNATALARLISTMPSMLNSGSPDNSSTALDRAFNATATFQPYSFDIFGDLSIDTLIMIEGFDVSSRAQSAQGFAAVN